MHIRSHRALERYRLAAVKLRQGGVIQVTRSLLLKRLRRNGSLSIAGQRLSKEEMAYVGFVDHLQSVELSYIEAGKKIESRGLVATPTRLAAELGLQLHSVSQYLSKRPWLYQKLRLSTQYDELKNAYRDAAACLKVKKIPVTRKALAYELNVPYATVAGAFFRNKDLANDIGLIDTRASRRR